MKKSIFLGALTVAGLAAGVAQATTLEDVKARGALNCGVNTGLVGFKELARRWRRWPAIAMGLVPVVLLMGLSFEKIDRFLPAG